MDLEEFKYGGTNITAFRLLDPEKPEIQNTIQEWIYGEQRYGRQLNLGQGLKVSPLGLFFFSLLNYLIA